jgi:hypothetical protein
MFLDPSEKEPVTSNYMRFNPGENTFRVLSSAITGMEYWKTKIVDGKSVRGPVRVKPDVNIPTDELELNERGQLDMPKYFWAFVVWNRDAERIQILEITQKKVQRAIRALTASKSWGDPHEYDIIVTKEGEKLETQYSVMPAPKEKLDPGITQLYKDMNINLEALFTGDDPFAPAKVSKDELEEVFGK